MKKIQPKKIVIQSFKGINVDKVLQDIKRVKRAGKEFEEAIDLHLISQNRTEKDLQDFQNKVDAEFPEPKRKLVRDNKGRFTKITKKTFWYKVFDKAMNAVACGSIAFLIIYTLFS